MNSFPVKMMGFVGWIHSECCISYSQASEMLTFISCRDGGFFGGIRSECCT